jgi:Zn-dependent protease with chaperone function/Zn-finger nucleic acid-binding protein
VLLALAFAGAAFHWWRSSRHLLDRILCAVGAWPLDPDDARHAQLANVVSEVAIAIGGRPIVPYVIRSPAVNACSAVDRDGRAAIAVTEGALALLTRPQLEAVVAHEAAHVASGDTLDASLTCGLFALYGEVGRAFLPPEQEGDVPAAVALLPFGVLGGLPIIVIPAVLLVLRFLHGIVASRLSREREHRADAAAVRYTRDPLSLAEALRLIADKPTSAGMRGLALAAIFVVSPCEAGDSTHPPVEERIARLLALAHAAPADLEPAAARRDRRPRSRPPEPAAASLGASAPPDAIDGRTMECPQCRTALERVPYAGTTIQRCAACGGCYADEHTVAKIVIRDEYALPDDVVRRAEQIRRRAAGMRVTPKPRKIGECPRCRGAMLRKPYGEDCPVEVEQCLGCGLAWFERRELEVAQYLLRQASG